MTFPDIFDVKMLIVANIFKDFHLHHTTSGETLGFAAPGRPEGHTKCIK